jgi:hypothetical protein
LPSRKKRKTAAKGKGKKPPKQKTKNRASILCCFLLHLTALIAASFNDFMTAYGWAGFIAVAWNMELLVYQEVAQCVYS